MGQRIREISQNRGYWLVILLVAIAMEAMALLYQYQWGYEPCVLCIHVRIWLLGSIAVAVPGLLLPRHRFVPSTLHLLNGVMMGGLLERAYQLLATERGWIFGSCNMDAGLPDWFALDRWFPALFEVKVSCGYTPELLFGITMAEGLMVFAATMVVISLILFLATLRDIVG